MRKMTITNDSTGCGSRCASMRFICLMMVWLLSTTGCAMWPQPTRSVHVGTTGPTGGCADFFAALDRQISASDAFESGNARVAQYPYLRTNRFIASFQDDLGDVLAHAAWIDHMQALDQSARQFEIANLSDSSVAALEAMTNRAEIYRKVTACGNLLKEADFLSAGKKVRLGRDATAQADYLPLRRILGLYPITKIFVSLGVKKWHVEARGGFSLEPPDDWQSIRYVPAVTVDMLAAHQITRRAERDALGIPAYSDEDRRTLFQTFAPIWEVQTRGDDDRIGSPAWRGDGRIAVDTARPKTYAHLSFTRFGQSILTQLNYIVWFPARPKEGVLDIYGGLLDGLNYRVTLDTAGDPILYETIHNCGCYYKAYPSGRLQVREQIAYAEPPLILRAPEINPARELMVVSMEHRTHYVRHLYPLPRDLQSTATAYALADYDELKSLPHLNGARQSMFNRYGLVTGSERLERFILWPTGVLSPGAMRQWGRHAVAFVGQRHFDDPFYLDEMFIAIDAR